MNEKTPLIKLGVYNDACIDILISSLNRQGYTTSFNEETYEITFGGPMLRVVFLEDEVSTGEKNKNDLN